MAFYEFARSIANEYIFCESYEERNAIVDYFRRNGVEPDSVMRRDMAAGQPDDRWLYPYYDPTDNELHACAYLNESESDVRFSDIADVICGDVYAIVIPELSGLLT